MPELGKCICCSGRISSEARECPHCGQPAPFHKAAPHPSGVMAGEIYEATYLQHGFFLLLELKPGVKASLDNNIGVTAGPITVRVVKADAEGIICTRVK